MNTPKDEQTANFKAYFEANLLDGDDIHTDSKGSMLNAQEVYSVMVEYLEGQEAREAEAYRRGQVDEVKTIKELIHNRHREMLKAAKMKIYPEDSFPDDDIYEARLAELSQPLNKKESE